MIAALTSASRTKNHLLVNILATEAHNRLAQRLRLEMALLEAEERYRLLAEHSAYWGRP